jgi:hypothetical protein
MKKCTLCHVEKPLSEFYSTGKNKQYLLSRCKLCMNQITIASRNKDKDKWKVYHRSHSLKSRYGITIEEYNKLLKQQNGVCAICKQPPRKKRLAVDHSHKNNIIRGLLCPTCNNVLGWLDKTHWLLAAMQYLKMEFE